jgi:hypothetical protein
MSGGHDEPTRNEDAAPAGFGETNGRSSDAFQFGQRRPGLATSATRLIAVVPVLENADIARGLRRVLLSLTRHGT